MPTRLVCAAIAAVLLTSCATTYWVHPNYTPEKFNKENYECERDMRQSGYYGQGLAAVIAANQFFERCMVAKGWKKERRSE